MVTRAGSLSEVQVTRSPARSMVVDMRYGTEEIDFQNPPYVSLERSHEHSHVVTASDDGELWLLVGTDSGFEGLTGMYYQEIHVTLQPVA